jgi:murein endopeptidase
VLPRLALILAVGALALGASSSYSTPAAGDEDQIEWQTSRSLGLPWNGRLVRGVQLPEEGLTYFTWDPIFELSPNRPWRRWGSDRLIRPLLRVLSDYADAHPFASRVGVGDLSRPKGGVFDKRFGGLGHASHQNGLDVDVYYPRLDELELSPVRPSQIDHVLAQELVTRFVHAGAVDIFVGPRTGLRGPRRIVQRLVYHDDHMHIRIGPDPRARRRLGQTAGGD